MRLSVGRLQHLEIFMPVVVFGQQRCVWRQRSVVSTGEPLVVIVQYFHANDRCPEMGGHYDSKQAQMMLKN